VIEHGDRVVGYIQQEQVDFRPGGIMRRYERGPEGTWHDGLRMELLADELIDEKLGRAQS
jgi:aminoglycoside 6'-N-acetyltransferase